MHTNGRPSLPTARPRCERFSRRATLHAPCALAPHPAEQGVDLAELLFSLHGFFMALGVDEIRKRSSADDKPLRMVKTILHELCKMKVGAGDWGRTARCSEMCEGKEELRCAWSRPSCTSSAR